MDGKANSARIGVFGTGNIGSDLLIKLSKSSKVSVEFVVGRSETSRGIKLARELGYRVFVGGLESLAVALANHPVDWLADASNASTHLELRHQVEGKFGTRVLDFTPSMASEFYSPGTGQPLPTGWDISLISCGGQSSLPVLAVLKNLGAIDRVELVSSLASRSVGLGTRENLDEYIETTERAISYFSQCAESKVVLIINPAEPPINMRVTLFVRFKSLVSADLVESILNQRANELAIWIPNLKFLTPAASSGSDIQISYQVTGNGDLLPPYAGNLDVLTHVAMKIFEGVA